MNEKIMNNPIFETLSYSTLRRSSFVDNERVQDKELMKVLFNKL